MSSDDVFTAFKNDTPVQVLWSRQTVNVTYDDTSIPTEECSLQFNLPEDIGPPVLFYYHLTNFYQNHRRYVSSYYDKQLAGTAVSSADVAASSCSPLKDNGAGLPYYPCGLIANSVFNDTFDNPVLLNVADGNDGNATYAMTEKGIAWDSDKALFKNISSETDLSTIAVPPNWQMRYPHGYQANNTPPDLGTDEHLMVWMRTAGLPNFSKLYMRNDSSAMKSGTYVIKLRHSESYNNTSRQPRGGANWHYRLPSGQVHRHKVNYHHHQNGHGWSESVLRHCLYSRRGNLYPPRRGLHGYPHDQAKVSFP